MNHNYKIELDVLASAGEEAIRRLGEEGNIIYVDFPELEMESKNKRNPQQYAHEETLIRINKLRRENSYENKTIHLPTGGELRELGESTNKRELEFITRNPARTSELSRKGNLVEWPEFLKYGTDVFKTGYIKIDHNTSDKPNLNKISQETGIEFYNNQFIETNTGQVYRISQNLVATNDRQTRYVAEEEFHLRQIKRNGKLLTKVPGFEPRGLEQRLAFMQLADPEVNISFIHGGSGSGKSIIAYVAALESILGTEKQRKNHEIKDGILLFKSGDIIGGDRRNVGFLKGDLDDKTRNIMESFVDAHKLCGMSDQIPYSEMLIDPSEAIEEGNKTQARRGKIGENYLPKRSPALKVEHLQWATGRTYPNKVLFVDEAQNMTPFEIKQLIEREGDHCKIFLTGDTQQVTNPELSPDFNGLVFAANGFYGGHHPTSSFINLDECHRGQAAETMRGIKAPRTFR